MEMPDKIRSAQWKSIKTAPKDGIAILVATREQVSIAWYQNGWQIIGGPFPFDPTHWMPLPPPPSGEGG